MLCGLAGMLFYLLLPLLAVLSHKMPITFWQALKLNLAARMGRGETIFHPAGSAESRAAAFARLVAAGLGVAIRWKSSFGDSSQIGLALTSFMFHLIHAILLFVCVWVAFDPPFSPRNLTSRQIVLCRRF